MPWWLKAWVLRPAVLAAVTSLAEGLALAQQGALNIERSLAFYRVQQTDRVDDGSASDFVNGNINNEHSIALSPPSSK